MLDTVLLAVIAVVSLLSMLALLAIARVLVAASTAMQTASDVVRRLTGKLMGGAGDDVSD